MGLPFSILTGFLGAGKTTALNRMLAASDRRVTVLVNELGSIGIDGRLVQGRGGDVLELEGGCVCCTIDVNKDLWQAITEVIEHTRPDHVVLETTGIAEPGVILQGLAALPPRVGELIQAAGVVCVVDAAAGVGPLERHPEARAQVDVADRVLLSKLDRAEAADAQAVHDWLAARAPGVERAAFAPDDSADRDLARFILEPRTLRPPTVPGVHRHQLTAISFAESGPMLGDALLAVARELGDRLVRVKGFVHVQGWSGRGFLELAGGRLDLRPAGEWPVGVPPRTEIVFIGEDLDEATVVRRLRACRVRERV